MRHLVGDGDVDALGVGLGRDPRVDQQVALEIEDRAPVLHGPEELAGARPPDQVELGQGIGLAEIVVVIGQDLGRRLQGEACVRRVAALDHHAHVDPADLAVDALEVAEAEEQQVGRHFRGFGEAHGLQLALGRHGLGDGHVGDGHQAFGNGRGDAEAGLAAGLIPAGQEPAGVGIFELGEQGPLGPARGLVVQGEQARGLLEDLAVIVEAQAVMAGLQRMAEAEAGGLDLVVIADAGRYGFAGQGGVVDDQVGGVEHDLARRLMHGQVDPHLALEGERRRIGGDRQVVVVGGDIGRQDHSLARSLRGRGQGQSQGQRQDRGLDRAKKRHDVPLVVSALARP